MDNIGSGEILVILLVALVVLGPNKLPHAAQQAGRFISEVRRIAASFKKEFRGILEEPIKQSQSTLNAINRGSLIKGSVGKDLEKIVEGLQKVEVLGKTVDEKTPNESADDFARGVETESEAEPDS